MHALPPSPENPGGRSQAYPAQVPAREATITHLDRHLSSVIALVIRGEIVAVTRHGRPVALILPLELAIASLPTTLTMSGPMKHLSDMFEDRRRRRKESRLDHGRWWDYARGDYRED